MKLSTTPKLDLVTVALALFMFAAFGFMIAFGLVAFVEITNDHIIATVDLSPETAEALATAPVKWGWLRNGTLMGAGAGVLFLLGLRVRQSGFLSRARSGVRA